MRIARCGLEIGMIEQPLYQFQVAGLAQHLAAEIMPEVVKAEAGHASALAQPPPYDLGAGVGEGVTLTLHTTVAAALGDVGEDHCGMMSAQRPKDFADR